MFAASRWAGALLGVAFAGACVPPAVVPTRPADRLPLVEIQIRNTPSQSDDYVGMAPAPARMRIVNHSAITSAVPVTLKYVDYQAGPALRFGSGGAATAASLNLTLPADGAWVPFVVAGARGQTSQRDKDAIIEVLEARPDGIVLGRKSLMVTQTSPIPASAPPIEIEVNGTGVVDDYVAWRPVRARVRLSGPSPGSADVPVVLRNMLPVTGGRLVFGQQPPLDTVVVLPTLAPTLALTLPGNGDWVPFVVAGSFGHPSPNDKDAVIEVVRADRELLGREGVMVRIRRNAANLTADERERFLNAVARVNADLGAYLVHQQIHGVAAGQAHGGPAFLPWHRAFVLRLERELQAVDPAVSLHYWRFDQAAPSVLHPDFMGDTPSGASLASFSASNPLGAWSIEGLGGVQRSPSYAASASPTTAHSDIITQAATLALGTNFSGFRVSEQRPHNRIHVETGNGGWLNFVPQAVRDPLFFMLHSNVDRLWALWQWTNLRFDPASALSYDPQGAYPGSGSVRLGHYVDDRMWPWDGTTGFVVPGDNNTLRPTTAPGGPIPASIGGWGPAAVPRPRDLIAYDRWMPLGVAGLGFGYDDVPFSNVP